MYVGPASKIIGGGADPLFLRLCLHMEPRRMEERKVCLNGCGDMTKIVVTLKLTKTPQKQLGHGFEAKLSHCSGRYGFPLSRLLGCNGWLYFIISLDIFVY